jgi:hypothetical protein
MHGDHSRAKRGEEKRGSATETQRHREGGGKSIKVQEYKNTKV